MNDEEKKETVIVPYVQEVRVYLNTNDDIVIARDFEEYERHSGDQDPDVFIVIPKMYVPRLIERLRELLALGS